MLEQKETAAAPETSDATPPPAAAQSQAPAAPVRPQSRRGDRVIQLTPEALAKQTREHQDKGRKAALSELAKKAKELGFDSIDELYEAVKKKAAPQPRQQQQNGQKQHDRQKQKQKPRHDQHSQMRPTDARAERELREKAERERRGRLAAEKRAEEDRRERWAAEARHELSDIARKAGIVDTETAVIYWQRECERQRALHKTDDEWNKWLDATNEADFFKGLKKSRPALFQEEVVLATTGTVDDGKGPPPPAAGQVTQAQVDALAVRDKVKHMSPAEWQDELRKRGLTPPSA